MRIRKRRKRRGNRIREKHEKTVFDSVENIDEEPLLRSEDLGDQAETQKVDLHELRVARAVTREKASTTMSSQPVQKMPFVDMAAIRDAYRVKLLKLREVRSPKIKKRGFFARLFGR